jgi:hypothetical protein
LVCFFFIAHKLPFEQTLGIHFRRNMLKH